MHVERTDQNCAIRSEISRRTTKAEGATAASRGDHASSPEAVAILRRLDDLLGRLQEADREKLSFAMRQTVKRITLRRERRGEGKHRITLWDGAIELRDDLGVTAVIPLTDDNLGHQQGWIAAE